jgi:hypothetical protein
LIPPATPLPLTGGDWQTSECKATGRTIDSLVTSNQDTRNAYSGHGLKMRSDIRSVALQSSGESIRKFWVAGNTSRVCWPRTVLIRVACFSGLPENRRAKSVFRANNSCQTIVATIRCMPFREEPRRTTGSRSPITTRLLSARASGGLAFASIVAKLRSWRVLVLERYFRVSTS